VEVNLPNAMVLSAEWRATTVDDVITYIMHQFGGTELKKIWVRSHNIYRAPIWSKLEVYKI
jgi:hypothetical protein